MPKLNPHARHIKNSYLPRRLYLVVNFLKEDNTFMFHGSLVWP